MKNVDIIFEKVNKLIYAYASGTLGGEKMPEDENPHLEKSSKENYMYFTLPMVLNYGNVLTECTLIKICKSIRQQKCLRYAN